MTRSKVPCPKCGNKTVVLRSVREGGDYCSYGGNRRYGYKPCRWRENVRATRKLMGQRVSRRAV